MFNNITQPKNVKFLNHLKYNFFKFLFVDLKMHISGRNLGKRTGSPALTDNYECYRWNFLNDIIEFLNAITEFLECYHRIS